MRNIMVDLETLGTTPGSAILSIGACVFNEAKEDPAPIASYWAGDNNYYRNIDLLDSTFRGLTVDPRTSKWWSEQSIEAVGVLTKHSVSLKGALNTFSNFLSKDDRVCSPITTCDNTRGPTSTGRQ